MQYQEFLRHIYQKYSGSVKLGLDRMQNVLAEMGDPQDRLHGFHVAGTNGKGSVCAALESIALHHGLSVGLNTSPHLIDYCERFRINGKDTAFQNILDLYHRFEQTFDRWDATFFEITTAIAFGMFLEASVQTAIIEVGVGGRLDATNLFVPDITAITSIGLDHVKTLGGTVELIAAEKAGIIKPSIPLILGSIDESPRQVILEIAQARNAPVQIIGRDFMVENVTPGKRGIRFDYRYGDMQIRHLQSNLHGLHQVNNLAIAITAFILYARRYAIPLSITKLRSALKSINWKGRMQILQRRPTLIIDGAHNVQGVTSLIQSLIQRYPRRKFVMIISILADKDYKTMIRLLCQHAKAVYIAQNGSDRAISIAEQVKQARRYLSNVHFAPTVAEVLSLALQKSSPRDIIIGGGSLYTVGEILECYNNSV